MSVKEIFGTAFKESFVSSIKWVVSRSIRFAGFLLIVRVFIYASREKFGDNEAIPIQLMDATISEFMLGLGATGIILMFVWQIVFTD